MFSSLKYAAEVLGMEGNVTERRLSTALVTPLWLDSSNTSIAQPGPPTAVAPHDVVTAREVSPRPEAAEDGLPPNKVQIQTADVPKIQLQTARHRGVAETFENTEVEELIAMLRETENLEDQGDILQYLVDTQGLDYNTGEYQSNFH
jgi:phosphorylase kinase alpha/beta subunit